MKIIPSFCTDLLIDINAYFTQDVAKKESRGTLKTKLSLAIWICSLNARAFGKSKSSLLRLIKALYFDKLKRRDDASLLSDGKTIIN